MGTEIDEKTYENLNLFFNEILMDLWSPRGGAGHATSSSEGWGGPLRNIPGMGVGTPTSNLQPPTSNPTSNLQLQPGTS